MSRHLAEMTEYEYQLCLWLPDVGKWASLHEGLTAVEAGRELASLKRAQPGRKVQLRRREVQGPAAR